jgi:molybdenum cofactor cytidylyltransferase
MANHPSADRSPPRIAVILLAAGLSRRMGAANKLLADIGGEPMIRRMARLYLACGLDVHVVTGHEREKVEAAVDGLDLSIVHNADYQAGQPGSVRAGLAAVAAKYDAVLVALGDQPALRQEDVEALIAAYAEVGGDRFLVPHFDGKRGNPVIIPGAFIPAILQASPHKGPLTDMFPDRLAVFDARNDHYVQDIDTKEALAHFRRKTP